MCALPLDANTVVVLFGKAQEDDDEAFNPYDEPVGEPTSRETPGFPGINQSQRYTLLNSVWIFQGTLAIGSVYSIRVRVSGQTKRS